MGQAQSLSLTQLALHTYYFHFLHSQTLNTDGTLHYATFLLYFNRRRFFSAINLTIGLVCQKKTP
jgi:hypothetical protein